MHKPACRSMNFSIYGGMLDRYKDSEDIKEACLKRGLNGLEVIRAGEPDQGKICPDIDVYKRQSIWNLTIHLLIILLM